MQNIEIALKDQFTRDNIDRYHAKELDLTFSYMAGFDYDKYTISFQLEIASNSMKQPLNDLHLQEIHKSSLQVLTGPEETQVSYLNTQLNHVTIHCKLRFESSTNQDSTFFEILRDTFTQLDAQQDDFKLFVRCIVTSEETKTEEITYLKIFDIENPFETEELIENTKVRLQSYNFKLAVIDKLIQLGYYSEARKSFSNIENLQEKLAAITNFYAELEIPHTHLSQIESIYLHRNLDVYKELRILHSNQDLDHTIETLSDLPLLPELKEFYSIKLLDVEDYSPLIDHISLRQVYDTSIPEETRQILAGKGISFKVPLLGKNIHDEIFWMYVDKGKKCFADKEYSASIDLFEKALTYKTNHQVISRIAVAYRQLGKLDLAMEYFHKAIEVKPTYSYALNETAYQYYSENKLDLALRDINIAVESDDYNMAFATKAEILFKMGDKEEEFFEALEESTCRGIDPKILDSAIAKKYENDPRYIAILDLPKVISFKKNNGTVYDNTILSLDKYYYSHISEEVSPHVISTDSTIYFAENLVAKLDSKLMPLLKIDLSAFSTILKTKIPVLYHENYQLDWTISSLDDKGLISDIYFADSKMLYRIEHKKINAMTFFDDQKSESENIIADLNKAYFHIDNFPVIDKPIERSITTAESDQWMIDNEIATNKRTNLIEYSANYGPVPLFIQNNYLLPSSPIKRGAYKYLGKIATWEFGLASFNVYLFYNEQENKVAQLMQSS